MTQMTEATESREHSMFERRVHALITGCVLLAFAASITLITAVRTTPPWQSFDNRWLGWMIDVRSTQLTSVGRTLSRIGGPTVTLPLRILVIAALMWQRRWLQLGAFLGATVCSELCIGPLKALIDRSRPAERMIGTSGASFPSGHAVAGAVTAFGVVVVFMHASPRRLIAIGTAAVFAGLMALSRTYLAVHWLSDVVVGVCIGTGMALVWASGLELARERYRATRNVA
jgi:membrane-associated phospholipid phosphatase